MMREGGWLPGNLRKPRGCHSAPGHPGGRPHGVRSPDPSGHGLPPRCHRVRPFQCRPGNGGSWHLVVPVPPLSPPSGGPQPHSCPCPDSVPRELGLLLSPAPGTVVWGVPCWPGPRAGPARGRTQAPHPEGQAAGGHPHATPESFEKAPAEKARRPRVLEGTVSRHRGPCRHGDSPRAGEHGGPSEGPSARSPVGYPPATTGGQHGQPRRVGGSG